MPAVSIVIPCYNAERWIAECIRSAQAQTELAVEVVVIDDGSNDGSLAVIRSFGDRVRWESGPNRGGNAARNRGLALARGEYVQFLDADDLLLPGKLAAQVACLERTGADVAYCDWAHQYHDADGSVRRGPVEVMQRREDMLVSLFARRWLPTVTLFFRRATLLRVGGWDETLAAAQDIDLTIRMAMEGVRFEYLPGCHALYRRYGEVTVSTSNRKRWLEANGRVAAKARARLEAKGPIAAHHRRALADYFFGIAREMQRFSPDRYRELLAQALAVDPEYRFNGSRGFRCLQRLLGFRLTETIAFWQRTLRA